MADPENRFVLSFNGEIYNYQELRQSLRDQWEFVTNGDTEVILAGLVLYGEAFIERLEGMWGFCFWDALSNTLILSRDRMGKKPVFYNFDPQRHDVFACASELAALATLAEHPWQEDPNSTADYLRYGYYLPGTTAYRDVCELVPGHYLKWTPGTSPVLKPYWSLQPEPFRGTKTEARSILHKKLLSAVKYRLIADVEVGAFLSGGVDSSLIVGIMSRFFQTKPKTFTIGFSEAAYDERDFASIIAKQYQTVH